MAPTPGRSNAARPLFVAGVPRSGTTGFTRYLNRHPEVLVCMERYKYLAPKEISPELFTIERILDARPEETNFPPQRYGRLIESKDPARLRWVGDKYPHYVRHLGTLARNNPGARFIVLYRPVEEVAESYAARAADPEDRWPAENGFETGIEHWNDSMRLSREFIGRRRRRDVLFVDYHRFFDEAESFVATLENFLELEFDLRVRRAWGRMSERYAAERRPKRELTPEQRSLVERGKDRDAERWVLDHMEKQGGNGRSPSAMGALARARPRRAIRRTARSFPAAPTFLIVGAQKGGTRWLRHNLGLHPDVFCAEEELHFFNSGRYRLGWEWYRRQFAGWSGERAIGEATPGYTMPRQRPERSAKRIASTLPGVRLLAVLRNPVERTYSAFIHHMERGRIDAQADLVEYVHAHPPEQDRFRLVAGGRYAENLEPYFTRFGPRLHVALNDDVRDRPSEVYRRALEHVEVDPAFAPPELDRVRFSNRAPRASSYRTGGSEGRRELSEAERVALYPYFADDIERLEGMIGRDLSRWRPG